MLIDINKVIIKDRIRKDFGDLRELADDIQQNGLINPPVVNRDYELLAGERRLKACKLLGWKQIEVRMMDTRDAEHELNVEISENENRKAFSKSERVDYMKRLLRIEQAKARERQNLGEKSHEGGRSDESTASQFGISSNTMRKEISISDHKELLTPGDFADWDEGRLSTNKAYQRIKAELDEKTRQIAEIEAKAERNDRQEEFYKVRIKVLSEENDELKAKEPVVVKVVPDDYETLKKQKASYEQENRRLLSSREHDADEIKSLKARLADLESRKDIVELQKKLEEEAGYFAIRTYDYIQKNGGYVWVTERMDRLTGDARKQFISAIYSIDAFAKQMIENIGGYGIE